MQSVEPPAGLTPEKLALLERRLRGAGPKRPGAGVIPRRAAGRAIPLSFAQRQMWFIDRMSPGNPAYNLPVGYRIRGPLNVDALERSVNEVVKRHEALRTTFTVERDGPRQVIHPGLSVHIVRRDLSALPAEERELAVRDAALRESLRRFDLSSLPLIASCLLALSADEHVLLVTVHHAVFDGWSVGILMHELDRFYRHFTLGEPAALPELAIQYGDYASWEARLVDQDTFTAQAAFWRNQLRGGVPSLHLPCDQPRPAVQSFNGSNVFFHIERALADQLRSLGAAQGCTLFMVVQAAFQVLLYRYSGMEDFVIGCPITSRETPDTQAVIGNFLNMIPLRADLSGAPAFSELLRRVRETTLSAFSNTRLPYEKMIEGLRFDRDLSRNPIFQAMLQVSSESALHLGGLEITSLEFDLGFSQLDLSLHLYEEAGGYRARFEYCTDLFEAPTIDRLSTHFMRILSDVVVTPDRRVSELRLLSEQERQQILFDWNSTDRDYPTDACIHRLFEQRAEERADRVAVEYEAARLTYRELNDRANRLAHYLLESGVKPGAIVGLFLERSIDVPVGMLGILKAGAAYVPMDPSFPSERLAIMMEDAAISTLVTHRSLRPMLTMPNLRSICIDADWSEIDKEDATNPCIPLDANSLAYTIYTSGSTGRPKGVMIEHRSVVNFLFSMRSRPGFSDHDVLLAVTTISFDIAGLEIYLPLVTGGKVVIASRDATLDGGLLLDLLKRTGATVLQATPATWKLLIEAGWGRSPRLRMLCGGEPLSRELADRLLERGCELWNMYGPTETTIWSSVQKIEASDDPILIGPPIANTRFYVVDNATQPVPVGVTGELLIGGDGLSRGYLNRSDLTSERFAPDPFRQDGSRVYRTGDLARLRRDGVVECLGRRDSQVKVRGFRIELGEIEHWLNQHEGVREAVVGPVVDDRQETRLAAYLIGSDGDMPNPNELRRYLAKTLPEYMIPSFFVSLESFPLTANGKIDRKALPRPDAPLLAPGRPHDSPKDELEIQLAAIWRRALRVKQLGVYDDFFELGGHSLLAAQVFAQINKTLGMNLPLAILFQAPTLRQLADLVRQREWRPSWKSLVPMHAQGDKPPLFLVHGAEGNVLLYRNLARLMGDGRPVYGLQCRGLSGDEAIERDIRRMASAYIEEVKSAQPEGPYFLGGYCVGGTIALEMAHQLRSSGHEVSLLALIETYNMRSGPERIPASLKLLHRIQNLYFHLRNLFLNPFPGRSRFFMEKWKVEASRFAVRMHVLATRIGTAFNPRLQLKYQHLLIARVNDRAQALYVPEPYAGTITLFRPKADFAGFSDRYLGWNGVARGGVQMFVLPSFPRGSLNEPFVGFLAQQLREAMGDQTNAAADMPGEAKAPALGAS